MRGADQQTLAVTERDEPASPRPQPALQRCWPKASVTSPVKQGLEQRGSWGLKCLILADRRLCWISMVHAPNGNLSFSLSSLSGVCLAGLFSFQKASLLLQVPQGFLLRFSSSSFSFSSRCRCKQESGELWWKPQAKGAQTKEWVLPPVSPMEKFCHAFGIVGKVRGTCLPCPVVEEVRQNKVQLTSLPCCRAKKLSARKKYQKMPLSKLNSFSAPIAATGHDGNLMFLGMGIWA